jgi:hypothetical protein
MVLRRVGRVPRFGSSKGFFPRSSKPGVACFCAACRGENDGPCELDGKKNGNKSVKAEAPSDTDGETETRLPRANRRTIADRIDFCGTTSTVVEVETHRDIDGEVFERTRFVSSLNASLEKVREYVGGGMESDFEVPVTDQELREVEWYAGGCEGPPPQDEWETDF